jgi:hypothetical protein
MSLARCSCGKLSLAVPDAPTMVVACHCVDCQRRTGAPFGAGAFYPAEAVTVSGPAKEYVRQGDSGGKVHNFFCPECGSTVFWRAEKLPAMIGVAVGALAGSAVPAPALSVFERSKYEWVDIGGAAQRFQASSVAKT